ncbi:MAG: Cu(I)-responsive transcriptional regulator [Candidatus Sericytochromatia bacterium]
MNIGQLAKASGVNSKLIRYYESIELIPAAQRTDSNYRVYRSEDVHLLKFIKRSRNLGFSIPEIEILLGLWNDADRSSAEVKDLATKHILALEAKAQEIQTVLKTLKQLVESCHGDTRSECPILEDLADGHL